MGKNWRFGNLPSAGFGTVTSKKTGHSMPAEYHPVFAMLGLAGGGGGGRGGGGSSSSRDRDTPSMPPRPGATFNWTFPQYSQTWAFTPPAPSPFNLPPAFDPRSETGYARPPSLPTNAIPERPTIPPNGRQPNRMPRPKQGALSPFSLPDLMAKYR